MLVIISWFGLLIGLAAFMWFFAIRARGSLRYWIRTVSVDQQWVLGKTFPTDDKSAHQQFFTDGNAAVRSLDRRTNKVIRQWDNDAGAVFLGLVLNERPEDPIPDGYELREFPAGSLLRLSGTNRLDEAKELDAVKTYIEKKGLALDLNRPMRLSGQSFSLYQWAVAGEARESGSMISRFAEATYQLRNNLVLPLLATWLAIALMGTAQPLLLVLGIVLICFLSGACKFVFIHQMTDEADEIHLQNY